MGKQIFLWLKPVTPFSFAKLRFELLFTIQLFNEKSK